MYPSISMAEIRRLYGPGEHRHWFDESSMRFFATKLPGQGLRTEFGNFFITSECNPAGVTAFSIRRQDLETHDIKTVGEFHSHASYAEAKQALTAHLKTLAEAACDSSM